MRVRIFQITVLLLLGCVPLAQAQTVNIYSSRHYDTDLALYEDFTKATGIKVRRLEAGADALIERIKSEGRFSPADLLITVDAGRLWRAEQAGILAPVKSEVLEARIPANLRHPGGLWFGLSKRARVIITTDDGKDRAPLSRYQDLADPAHRGQICMRSSANVYNISLMASLIGHLGQDAAQQWAQGVVANFGRKPQSNDTGNIRAVASGACAISMVNSYYLARLAASQRPNDLQVMDRIQIIFPNQGSTGTHVNISGAGLVKTAPNREAAIKFLEYLTEERAQSYFANGNHEYPVVEGIAPTSAVASLGAFEEDRISASVLGEAQKEAIKTFDRAGWK